MAITYVVRAGQRISIHCPFLYHGENFHGKGHLWDLSETAFVRWSNGRDAGWEIRTIDATSRARLIRFLDQVGDELSCKSVGAGSR